MVRGSGVGEFAQSSNTPILQHSITSITPARNASRSDAGGPSLRAAGFEDEDSLPDEALALSAATSACERSWDDEDENEDLTTPPPTPPWC